MSENPDYRDRIAELIRLIALGKASGHDIAELHLLQKMRVRSWMPAGEREAGS